MAELVFDVFEDILVRLDVKDLIRCKSVCKSWQSFISSPRFVKAHLKHAYNNDLNNHQLGHRRIGVVDEDDVFGYTFIGGTGNDHSRLEFNCLCVVGSCNGLVCVCPKYLEFVVTNPSTREHKKLPTPPYHHFPLYPHLTENRLMSLIRAEACWGFGYDSSIDDYKVIVGFLKKKRMLFHVLTLKSNTWKFMGHIKYYNSSVSGVLCGGALHWFMIRKDKKVIVSLDLSTEEFKEIPQPADVEYASELGIIDGCLCIFWDCSPFSSKIWVMKNSKWERYNNHCGSKYDVVHDIPENEWPYMYGVNDDGKRVPSVGSYICASTFVKSLVSPHPHVTYEGQKRIGKEQQGKERIAEGNIRKRKRNTRKKRLTILDNQNQQQQQPAQRAPPKQQDNNGGCYQCGAVGHFKRDCPQLNNGGANCGNGRNNGRNGWNNNNKNRNNNNHNNNNNNGGNAGSNNNRA